MKQERFWMVFCEDGQTPPRFRHFTRPQADEEATRLASANPGKTFYSMKAVAGFKSPITEVEKIEFKSMGIPF